MRVIPDHHWIIFRQAVCALSHGDTKEANDYIKKYRLVREADGLEDYWIKYDIGRIYRQAEEYDKAMEIFSDLIAEDPLEPRSKAQLAFVLIDNEIDIVEGIELIDQALEIEPENWDFLYTKGLGCYKQGKVKEAHEIINKAWDLRPKYNHDHYQLLQEVEQALASLNQ